MNRMKLFQSKFQAVLWLPGILALLLAGCGTAHYDDPVNPKHPYTFPGQISETPSQSMTAPPEAIPAPAATISAQPTAGTAPATPAPAPEPARMASPPALPDTSAAPTLVTAAPAPVQIPTPVLTPVSAQPQPLAAVPQPSISAPVAGSPVQSSSVGSPTELRVGDTVTISFSDLPAPGLLPITVELGPDGKLTLHLNIIVYALGKTARQLEQEIRSEYVPKYFKYLTVTVKAENRRFFHVNGEVRMPGSYPWLGESTVLRAIGQAQGFTDFAKRTKVTLTRPNGEKHTINCDEAQRNPAKDLPVFPGDYINVPKKPWWGF